eukprot:6275278-Karenia_brevis.AAC.1
MTIRKKKEKEQETGKEMKKEEKDKCSRRQEERTNSGNRKEVRDAGGDMIRKRRQDNARAQGRKRKIPKGRKSEIVENHKK